MGTVGDEEPRRRGVDSPRVNGDPESDPYPDNVPDFGSGGSSGGSTGAGGTGPTGSGGATTTIGMSGTFHLATTGAPVEPNESDGAIHYTFEFTAENTVVAALLDGVEIETGIAGLMPVKLSSCTPLDQTKDTCSLELGGFGAGPAGSNADTRLQGFGSRPTIYGTAIVSPDGWTAQLLPDELTIDLTRVVSESEFVYYQLLVSEVSFDCSLSVCDIEVWAQ